MTVSVKDLAGVEHVVSYDTVSEFQLGKIVVEKTAQGHTATNDHSVLKLRDGTMTLLLPLEAMKVVRELLPF